MESMMKEVEHLEIKLEEIKSATNNFDKTKVIGSGGFGYVFEGEVSHSKGRCKVAIKRLVRKHGQGEPEFLKEMAILSRYTHKNLISLLGFCDDGVEKILVYEHASRGSLDRYLNSTTLTWKQRIKICLDAARGISYLHDPRETHQRVLHRDIKSANILLDDKWNAKVSDMGLSKIGPANQLHTALFTNAVGTIGYCDPEYMKTYTLTKESDIYSLGVVLFEVLCGRLCFKSSNSQYLVIIWKQCYQEKKLDKIIFQNLEQPMDPTSLKIFSDIAFQCLQESRERPAMSLVVEKLEIALKFQEQSDHTLQKYEEIPLLTNSISIYEQKPLLSKEKELEHLKFQLEEIKRATNNFDRTKVIGSGRFGDVYAGEVPHSKGQNMVAFKRLDHKFIQGDPEFWWEVMMLSRYTHENLISLLGFCNESDEVILMYEYASNGSLDRHLSSTSLTWTQRIKICLHAAKGLSYLHDGKKGTQQRVIHRDIKSSNILLDDNWNAKVSDFGLSRVVLNQQHMALLANVVGTPGYCDPLYLKTGLLTKESDVYSFGVVLFEVLCGTLCFENSNGRFLNLMHIWKESYEKKKLDAIIFQDLVQPMDPTCLETFSDIAFQCLHKSRKQRPTMSLVVEKLEIALGFQKLQDLKLQEYEEILKAVISPLRFKSAEELNQLLSEGVYLYSGKTWFSLNEKGKRCVMISINQCLVQEANEHHIFQYSSEYNSRFPVGCYSTTGNKFKTHVRTQFLSPLITYTVNFVFKFKNGKKESKEQYIALKYKLEGETKTSIVYLADEREDEWLMAELYQFTSDGTTFDLEIIFEDNKEWLVVEGIEFQPLEKVEHEALEDDKVDMQTVSDSDPFWEQKLPNDYKDIINWSKDDVQWKTKKELHSILCKGFLINNGEEWFSLDEYGKKCHMLSPKAATTVITKRYPTCQSSHESRFGEAYVIEYDYLLHLLGDIKSQLVSPETTYACYLVYKLPEDQSKCEAPVEVRYEDLLGSDDRKVGYSWYIYLVGPQTPVIRPNGNQNTHNPLNRPKIKGLPQQRSDGWMEVQVWEVRTTATTEMIPMRLSLTERDAIWLHGLVLQGIEFRPI